MTHKFAVQSITIGLICLAAISVTIKARDISEVLVIPYVDNTSHSELISAQVAWMINKKLETINVKTIDRRNFITKEQTTDVERSKKDIKKEQQKEMQYWYSEEFQQFVRSKYPHALLMNGEVLDLGVDKTKKKTGHSFIGLCNIPVYISLRSKCIDLDSRQQLWSIDTTGTDVVPRVRVFGFYRSPFPESPRSIDSLIHSAVIDLVENFKKTVISEKAE